MAISERNHAPLLLKTQTHIDDCVLRRRSPCPEGLRRLFLAKTSRHLGTALQNWEKAVTKFGADGGESDIHSNIKKHELRDDVNRKAGGRTKCTQCSTMAAMMCRSATRRCAKHWWVASDEPVQHAEQAPPHASHFLSFSLLVANNYTARSTGRRVPYVRLTKLLTSERPVTLREIATLDENKTKKILNNLRG